MGTGFYGSNDPTNGVKALKEDRSKGSGFNPIRSTPPCSHWYNNYAVWNIKTQIEKRRKENRKEEEKGGRESNGSMAPVNFQTVVVLITATAKIKAPNHCPFHLLPPRRPLHQTLWEIGHGFELPGYNYNSHKQSFVIDCLFKYSK